MLKIEKNCKISDFMNIIRLVPNCESLDIAKIKFQEDKCGNHGNAHATMVKLNDVHVDICDDANDIFWRSLVTPALTKLSADLNRLNTYKLDEIFGMNRQVKILEFKPSEVQLKYDSGNKFEKKKLVFESLKNVTLNEIIDRSYLGNWPENDNLLLSIIKTQPELRILRAHNIGELVIENIFTHLLNLEILELTSFRSRIKVLKKVINLTNLKELKLKDFTPRIRYSRTDRKLTDFNPEFIASLAQANKNLRRFELNGQFYFHEHALLSVLGNFTNLESLCVGRLNNSILSSDFYLPFNCENSNLKELKFFESVPLRLFAKFIFDYPNLESLEVCTFRFEDKFSFPNPEVKKMKVDGSRELFKLIHKAKESSEDKKIVITELIKGAIVIKHFEANELLKLQLTLIQLGWPNLKTLIIYSGFNYENIQNHLDDFFKANKHLKLFEIRNNNEARNNLESYERFRDRFDKIMTNENLLSLRNTKEDGLTSKLIKVSENFSLNNRKS
jgi:hypothetical protein